jgi:tRNA nucleotidyltransferase/poly(A) polymerase
MLNVYEVGGSIRDQILGLKSKDIDFGVECESFSAMKEFILSLGGEIFQEIEEFFTIRARVNGFTNDYVFCRIEGPYSDGRHPDWVKPGTILDDLARREFTMNAMARKVGGSKIIDPFGGIEDLITGQIKCVGDTYQKISQDPIRMLRALRFSITKNMDISLEIERCLNDPILVQKLIETVSPERIREELLKMFDWNTYRAISMIWSYPLLALTLFDSHEVSPIGIWLKPTNEKHQSQ